MKDKQILMNTFSVQAILEGKKSMTRRVIKPQPFITTFDKHFRFVKSKNDNNVWKCYPLYEKNGSHKGIIHFYNCPYQIGQHVYVKETYEILDYNKLQKTVDIKYIADGEIRKNIKLTKTEWEKYRRWKKMIGKKSSLYMFKSLARIWLLIENVRTERVQDISENDAKNEGVEKTKLCDPVNPDTVAFSYRCPFADLWDEINARRGYDWIENTYIWAYTFKRINK